MKLNKFQRLDYYKRALLDYEISLRFSGHDRGRCFLAAGFCLYFEEVHRISTYNDFQTIFPELYYCRQRSGSFHYLPTGFYDEGIEIRIRALKKAIRLTEKQITIFYKIKLKYNELVSKIKSLF